ncbi:co-chaperone YbbN [Photobacterium damselae subsp. damselae]|uniref:co-chaperone YbbN n=1 Tax=Photobacterium damselae TaxID=38293 RepID=UPI00083A6544|nr:co-chaperone YbbN [Photobacterium damselae]QSH57948.1 co-chaperone YbbN [Photobacterium damselae subsp. damselae]
MNSSSVIEITEQNLQQVLEQSMSSVVVISFWAPSMPETIEVNRTLEQISQDYPQLMTLATLDCERQPMVAGQFGVRGLPTVAVFKNGQPVDGSAGPQTEQSLREMLGKYLPSPEELALKHALSLVDQKDYLQALPTLRQLAPQFPQDNIVNLAIAECLLETAQFNEAEEILNQIPMQDQDAKYKGLLAKLELHKEAADSPEIRELEQKWQLEPNNFEVGYELAIQYSQTNRNEEALEILLSILKKDLNFADGQAKKSMLDLLAALGQGNTLASRYRRQLYALLY